MKKTNCVSCNRLLPTDDKSYAIYGNYCSTCSANPKGKKDFHTTEIISTDPAEQWILDTKTMTARRFPQSPDDKKK